MRGRRSWPHLWQKFSSGVFTVPQFGEVTVAGGAGATAGIAATVAAVAAVDAGAAGTTGAVGAIFGGTAPVAWVVAVVVAARFLGRIMANPMPARMRRSTPITISQGKLPPDDEVVELAVLPAAPPV